MQAGEAVVTYTSVAAEVLREALRSVAVTYGRAADRAARQVRFEREGEVAPCSVGILDEWHEAVLRQEQALELLRLASAPAALPELLAGPGWGDTGLSLTFGAVSCPARQGSHSENQEPA